MPSLGQIIEIFLTLLQEYDQQTIQTPAYAQTNKPKATERGKQQRNCGTDLNRKAHRGGKSAMFRPCVDEQ